MADTQKRRPLVFVAVGIGNTLVDFAFYTLLSQTVFKEKPIALTGLVSGTLALVVAFMTHSFITWRGTEVSRRTLLRFVAFTGFGMWVIRPTLLALFIHVNGLYNLIFSITHALHLPFSRSFVYSTGAFGLMIVIVLLYNYLVYDRYVFNRRPAAHIEPESR